MSYSATTDLQTGNIPTGSVQTDLYVNLAAEEIDSKIGFIYKTPVDMSTGTDPVPNATTSRAASLLLKRLNNQIATARILLAIYSPAENQELNAYGKQLLDDAEVVLDQIVKGEIRLTGAQDINGVPIGGDTDVVPTAALMGNYDNTGSGVDAFYNKLSGGCFVNPFGVTFDA